MKFEVSVTVHIQHVVVWIVESCSFGSAVDHFKGTSCLNLQGQMWSENFPLACWKTSVWLHDVTTSKMAGWIFHHAFCFLFPFVQIQISKR